MGYSKNSELTDEWVQDIIHIAQLFKAQQEFIEKSIKKSFTNENASQENETSLSEKN